MAEREGSFEDEFADFEKEIAALEDPTTTPSTDHAVATDPTTDQSSKQQHQPPTEKKVDLKSLIYAKTSPPLDSSLSSAGGSHHLTSQRSTAGTRHASTNEKSMAIVKEPQINPSFYKDKILSQHRQLEAKTSTTLKTLMASNPSAASAASNGASQGNSSMPVFSPAHPLYRGEGGGGAETASRRTAMGGASGTGDETRGDEKGKLRQVGVDFWKDDTLDEWPENDFRIFVGNLGKETTDRNLEQLFCRYPSFNMARVVKMNKKMRVDGRKAAFNVRREVCRGYGFVSFSDPKEMLRAIREQNGKYCLTRPMQIKRGKWADREINNVRKKTKVERKHKKYIKQ